MKSAIFDDGINNITAEHFPQITVTGPLLFWLSVVLFLTAFVCFVISMVRKSELLSGAERIFFSLVFTVHIVSFYAFYLSYPFACTIHIRYAMPLIPLCIMGLAVFIQTNKETKFTIWFRRIMYGVTAAFCAMSYLVYTQLAL